MLTLNIEDGAIKITLVKGKRVAAAIEEPLQAGWVQNGMVVDVVAVSQQLARMLAANHIDEKQVLACVSGMHAIYRVVYLPKFERTLLAEAAKREMERAVPVPLDTLYTYWQDLKVSDVEIALCLLGLPCNSVDALLETIRLSGLQLSYLELKPVAVSRAVNENTCIIIDVQDSGVDISILDNRIPELIRSMSFTGALMSDVDKIALIKEEADRTVNFHNSSHKDRPLGSESSCFISGNLRDNLSSVLGYAVKPMPSFLAYPPGCDEDRFVANTGMALRSVKNMAQQVRVDINVTPRLAPSKPARQLNLLPLAALITGAAIIAVTFVVSQIASQETINLQVLVDQKSKAVSDIQKVIKEETDKSRQQIEGYKQSLNTLRAPLAYCAQQREYANRDLGEIMAKLPGIMYLTSVHDDTKYLNIEGSAPSAEMVLNYARDLRNSGRFRFVLISSMDNKDYNEVKFKLVLTLNR